MKNITIYNDFDEFYNKGYELVKFVETSKMTSNKSKQIQFAREFFDISVLRSYICYGTLTNEAKEKLKSNIKEVRFSIDNIVKNIIKHPELKMSDYKLIPIIIANPTKIIEDREDILLFKQYNKYYKVVIKTTKNKNENFIKSFRLLNEKEFNKY